MSIEAATSPSPEVLREGALEVARRLTGAGFQACFVGGCVRDQLLGLPIKDFDIATNARPEQVTPLFDGAKLVGAKFGVVLVRVVGIDYEVATFRRDGQYLDHRHPDTVSYGTMEDDVQRRDFTINALFMDPATRQVTDLVGGLPDLKAGVLRCVGEPGKRFNEDALRLLRAIRFAIRFGFEIEPLTWQAMREHAPTIQYVSPERQRVELTTILCGRNAGRAVRLMEESGLLHWLLPEIVALKGVEQGREFHPEGDVYTHTLLVLEAVEPRTVVNVWGALLHDVGKAATFRRDPETRRISFHEHEEVGAAMAREILARLRFGNDEIEAIASVVSRHMMFLHVRQMKESTLRRFISAPTIENDLAVHRADCLGSNGKLDYWEEVRRRMSEFSQRAEPVIPAPLVTGNDLMALGYRPGPKLGAVLKAVGEKQLDGELRSKEDALCWLQALAPNDPLARG